MSVTVFTYVALAFTLAWYLSRSRDKYSHIPTTAAPGPLSYIDAFRFIFSASDVARENYVKFKSRPFKVATLSRWIVVLGNPQLMEEMRRAPDDKLSSTEAVKDALEVKYTMGDNFIDNMYHIPIIRNKLTRLLDDVFPDVWDEVVTVTQAVVGSAEDDDAWRAFPAMETLVKIVCQAGNRVFVGLPLCRNDDFLDLCSGFALDVFKKSIIIKLFPRPFAPLVAAILGGPQKTINRGIRHLQPVIEARQKLIAQHGKDYPNKPNDFLSWLIDEAKGDERTMWNFTLRILGTNLGAVHSSAMLLTHAVYNLAADPDTYVKPMREEIEMAVQNHGWTKAAVDEMYILDSFIKETGRIFGTGPFTLARKTVDSFTFSDGTCVPPGTTVVGCSLGLHLDSAFYPDAETFDGFRFSRMQKDDGIEADSKRSLVATRPDWLIFGYGRHACPGRFFASVLLKAIIARLVMTYDIKLETGNVRPPNLSIGEWTTPNRTANILLRKRREGHAK